MKKILFAFIFFVLLVLPLSAYSYGRQSSRLSNAINRRVINAQQRDQALLQAVQDSREMARVRALLEQGADPCRALTFAVFANNAQAVAILSEYKNRCNWKYAVEERLQFVMKKGWTDLFYALMADNRGITCPDPFHFVPSERGAQWHPLAADMLAAVNQRCFATRQAQSTFLKGIILLNPNQNYVFALGETYKAGIHSQDTQRRWLAHINQLVNAHVKVSSDTLQEVIAQSRIFNVYDGISQLPFDTTRQLVKLCLKGGADGSVVLNRLNHSSNSWVWEKYSADERMRLSNILENKPETQSRTFGDKLRKAYHKFF